MGALQRPTKMSTQIFGDDDDDDDEEEEDREGAYGGFTSGEDM